MNLGDGTLNGKGDELQRFKEQMAENLRMRVQVATILRDRIARRAEEMVGPLPSEDKILTD